MVAARKMIFLLSLSLLLSQTGCVSVEKVESPQSWGSGAGEYAAKEWQKENQGSYPTENGIAAYCVSISETGAKEYGWSFNETIESSDACVESFVKGLE